MITKVNQSIRQAISSDQKQLANLIHFGTYVHRHLDWRPPLEWIGHEPFLVLETDHRLIAALACPPDPEAVNWIRLFVVYDEDHLADSWLQLWSSALELYSTDPKPVVAAIPLQDWFEKLLQKSQFQMTSEVVMLTWGHGRIPDKPAQVELNIRPMTTDDLPRVEALDKIAFGTLWHNSQKSLEYAFNQATIATLAEIDQVLVAYQISTSMQLGGHLARLATHPAFQRKGIGYAILRDLMIQFKQRGVRRVTVNTQEDNFASIALYKTAGFELTGESFPVYQYVP